MVAVVSVVVNHFSNSMLPGGFVGVDVFFVISGYLITGRLMRTVANRSVRSYFGSFYALRARRILPAALVTLALTTLAAQLLFVGQRAHAVVVDASWSALFAANWHLASSGTNYFSQNVATSPLQHFWSLSVEEQYYVVWPIVVLLVAGAAARHGQRPNAPVGIVAALLVAISFIFAWQQTHNQPQIAYFSTFSRAWELGVGALLAAILPLLKPFRQVAANALSWIGMALIGVAIWITPTTHGFPAPWAALAVVGSAAVIAAGSTGPQPFNPALTNPASVWVGDLSYSIYLFHFPIYIFANAEFAKSPVTTYGVAIAGTLFLSIASFYFVEEPARSGSFVTHEHLGTRALAALAAGTLALTVIALRPVPKPLFTLASVSSLVTSTTPTVDPSLVQPLPDLQAALAASLSLASWPKLSNQTTVDLGPGETGCDVTQSFSSCAFTPQANVGASKVVVLLGDSVMVSWQSMLKSVFLPNGWTVISLAHADCFAAEASYADTLQGDGGALKENTQCESQHQYTDSVLASLHPSVVLLDDQDDATYKISDGHGHLLAHPQQVTAYTAGLNKTIGVAKSAGAKVVVMSATPNHREWATCRVAGSTPADCTSRPEAGLAEIRALDVRIAQQTGATYVDTIDLWCYQNLCPDVVGTLGTIRDNHHITAEYGVRVAPSLEADFIRRGII